MDPLDPGCVLTALRTLLEHAHLATPGQLLDVVALAAAELGSTTSTYLVDDEQVHLS